MNARFSLPALSAAMLMTFAVPSLANHIDTATGTVTCTSYSLEFTGGSLNGLSHTISYTVTLHPSSGPDLIITGSKTFPTPASGNTFDITVNQALGPLTQSYTVSGTATLFTDGSEENTVAIVFTSSTVTCI